MFSLLCRRWVSVRTAASLRRTLSRAASEARQDGCNTRTASRCPDCSSSARSDYQIDPGVVRAVRMLGSKSRIARIVTRQRAAGCCRLMSTAARIGAMSAQGLWTSPRRQDSACDSFQCQPAGEHRAGRQGLKSVSEPARLIWLPMAKSGARPPGQKPRSSPLSSGAGPRALAEAAK